MTTGQSAIGGSQSLLGASVLALQELAGDAQVNVIPRQLLIQVPLALCLSGKVSADSSEGSLPACVREILMPGFQDTSLGIDLFNHRSQAAVAPAQH